MVSMVTHWYRRPMGPHWATAAALLMAMLGITVALVHAQSRGSSNSPMDGHTLARRYFEEVWNQGKVDVLDELLSPDYVNHTPSFGTPPPGPSGLKPIVLAIRRAFPDLHFTIDDVIVAPDAIVIRTTMTGTHEGDLFGIAPTHRSVKVMQIQIERMRKGRIVEHWRVTDELTMMRQLGVAP
jgi:predicted ester cyclase